MTELEQAVDRLVGQVRHWSPVRWVKPVADGSGTRAGAVHALAQRLADASADAEGEPRRSVPRLENDLALSDQILVLCADLRRAGSTRPDLIAEAAAAVRATTAAL